MRWIFFLLLFTNVGMLGWRYVVGLPATYLAPPVVLPERLPANVEKVLLLSEQNQTGQVTQPTRSASSAQCRLVGPFPGRPEANVFFERLRVLDVVGEIRTISKPAGESYWVYLESFGSRASAKAELDKLQARGIDSYILTKGDLENGISLGVYSELTLANARMEDLLAKGLEPKMRSVPRSFDEWWVELTESEVQKIAVQTWSKLLRDPFELKEKQKSCLDVASVENFQ